MSLKSKLDKSNIPRRAVSLHVPRVKKQECRLKASKGEDRELAYVKRSC
jgi:hypothetical protein